VLSHSPAEHYSVVILGAGPTGLGAAHRLVELGYDDFIVIERENSLGGLASSRVDDQGFTWDLGGHVQYSHYEYFDRVMDRTVKDWLTHPREGWVWVGDLAIPYPIQANLHYLDRDTCLECLNGLAFAKGAEGVRRARSLEDWLRAVYGPALWQLFMRPYNEKVWACPLDQMSFEWLRGWKDVKDGALAAGTQIEEILRRMDEQDRTPATALQRESFRYPAAGGTGGIWSRVAEVLGSHRLLLKTNVLSIDAAHRSLTLDNGRRITYDYLVSTIPITHLIKLAGLRRLDGLADKLFASAVDVVGIGVKGVIPEKLDRKCWIYFAAPHIPFHRLTVFSRYSPAHVPDAGHWSLMAEIASSPLKAGPEDAVAATICGLMSLGFIDDDAQVVSKWHYRNPMGYPVPTLERDPALEVLQNELAPSGIFSRGRFGGWKYEVSNQDQAFMQGVEVIDYLALGVPELTYWHPEVVNDRSFYKRGPRRPAERLKRSGSGA
jgi:protoporphyrinogen oxidase